MVTSAIPKFLGAFILIIIGLIFINVIATQSLAVTNPTQVTNEALSLAPARLAANQVNTTYPFTTANAGLFDLGGLVPNSIVITNASGTVITSTNYTVNYTAYPDTITFSNNTFMVAGGGAGNATLLAYQYYGNSYIQANFGRDTLNMLGGFFALALIGVGIGLFYSIGKEYKII